MRYQIEHEESGSYQRVLTIVDAESISQAIEKLMDEKHWLGASDIFSAKMYLEVEIL